MGVAQNQVYFFGVYIGVTLFWEKKHVPYASMV